MALRFKAILGSRVKPVSKKKVEIGHWRKVKKQWYECSSWNKACSVEVGPWRKHLGLSNSRDQKIAMSTSKSSPGLPLPITSSVTAVDSPLI